MNTKPSRVKLLSSTLPQVNKVQRIVIFLFSCIYSILLVNFSLFSSSEIADRVNYLQYAQNSQFILYLRLAEGDILALIASEPLWLLINTSLITFFKEPEFVVKTIIVISSFLCSYVFLRLSSKYLIFAIICLVIPQIMKNYIVHIRQGLGLAIFMLGLLFSDQRKYLFFMLSSLIHSSFFFVLLIFQLDNFFAFFDKRRKLSIRIKTFLCIIVSIATSFSIGSILMIFKDRRLQTYDFGQLTESFGFGWLFWLCILILIFLSGEIWMKKNFVAVYSITFYLSTYFILPVSARIFESTMFCILISCFRLTNYRKLLFIIGIMLYALIQWVGYKSIFFV